MDRHVAAILAMTSVTLLLVAAAPVPPASPDPAPPPSGGEWRKLGQAEISVLDKIATRREILTVKAGDSGRFESLTIRVLNCLTRPDSEPRDSAAFLEIADSHAGTPAFRGWMFSGEPAVAMLEHPVYDVRVVRCR
jgi:hypothetical protein